MKQKIFILFILFLIYLNLQVVFATTADTSIKGIVYDGIECSMQITDAKIKVFLETDKDIPNNREQLQVKTEDPKATVKDMTRKSQENIWSVTILSSDRKIEKTYEIEFLSEYTITLTLDYKDGYHFFSSTETVEKRSYGEEYKISFEVKSGYRLKGDLLSIKSEGSSIVTTGSYGIYTVKIPKITKKTIIKISGIQPIEEKIKVSLDGGNFDSLPLEYDSSDVTSRKMIIQNIGDVSISTPLISAIIGREHFDVTSVNELEVGQTSVISIKPKMGLKQGIYYLMLKIGSENTNLDLSSIQKDLIADSKYILLSLEVRSTKLMDPSLHSIQLIQPDGATIFCNWKYAKEGSQMVFRIHKTESFPDIPEYDNKNIIYFDIFLHNSEVMKVESIIINDVVFLYNSQETDQFLELTMPSYNIQVSARISKKINPNNRYQQINLSSSTVPPNKQWTISFNHSIDFIDLQKNTKDKIYILDRSTGRKIKCDVRSFLNKEHTNTKKIIVLAKQLLEKNHRYRMIIRNILSSNSADHKMKKIFYADFKIEDSAEELKKIRVDEILSFHFPLQLDNSIVSESYENNSYVHILDENGNRVPIIIEFDDNHKTLKIVPKLDSFRINKKYRLFLQGIRDISGTTIFPDINYELEVIP